MRPRPSWVLLAILLVACRDGSAPPPNPYPSPFPVVDLGVISSEPRGGVIGFITTNPSGTLIAGTEVDSLGVTAKGFLWNMGTRTDLGSLGGNTTEVGAVNDSGQVVGSSKTQTYPFSTHAFLWQKGAMKDLGTLGGINSVAHAMNNRGQIVGESTTAGDSIHAFLWQNGIMTDLGTLNGGFSSAALAINDSGDVVGESWTAFREIHAVLWRKGSITDLGTTPGCSTAKALNNLGQIVGETFWRIESSYYCNSGPPINTVPVLWRDGVMSSIDNLADSSTARSMNVGAPAQVVGWFGTYSTNAHAFVWQNNAKIDLGTLGGPTSYAFSVTYAGDVLGKAELPGTPRKWHAVFWKVGLPR